MALRKILLPVLKDALRPQMCPKITTNLGYVIAIRQASTIQLSKNLSLITADKRNIKVSNLKLHNLEKDKSLVVLHAWLMARRKHIMKYADMYLERGIDVLCVTITPWQLLWPTKGSQVVASDILRFLDQNVEYAPLLLHGFSVGGYVWGEVMVQMASESERYKHVLDRIHGQVWDSVADITEITIGLPAAVFPRNSVMRSALRQYITYHLKAFDKVATSHYIRASQMFHTNLVKAPAQFFLSKSDPVGAFSSNSRAKETWENMGMQVSWKCWDKSPHVGHLHHHPKEYKEEMSRFLDSLQIAAPIAEKLKAKI